jgi:hypothetical protein
MSAADILAAGKSPAPQVAKVLKEAYALSTKPVEFAKALGEKDVDADEAKEIANELRPHLAARLVLADWKNRQAYLTTLVEVLRDDATKGDDGPKRGPTGVASLLTELGPAGKDAAPGLVQVLRECTDPRNRAAVARVLRAIDVESARKAGVR